MEGFCRGCLIKYDDPEELLEYTEKNRRLFVYSTGLQVKRNDTFTFQLCKDCYLNMKQACKFKKLCRTSDKKFKTYLSLKDAGETADLCTYLKCNDDNFSLRFPPWGGNSTPANQKRDDDNESTCTSIGNFMRDILQGAEMPDTEARIVRQVIEEEADVLDESLDSHWLQDDVSIATDFRLDFSFSPFSTPRSITNDHCYTPKRLTDQPADENNYNMLNSYIEKPHEQEKDVDKPIEIKDFDDILSDGILDNGYGDKFDNNVKNASFEKEIEKIEQLITEQVPSLTDDQINQVNYKNYYVDNTFKEATVSLDIGVRDIRNEECGIDRRLDEALKDGNNKEFSLQDLLGSPTVYPTAEAPSTPTINNILFGERLDDENGDPLKVGQTIERFENVQGDIELLDELMTNFDVQVKMEPMSPEHNAQNAAVADLNIEIEIKEETEREDNAPAEGADCVCTICDRKFKTMGVLKTHSVKAHNIRMPRAKRKRKWVPKLLICDYCGKEDTDKRNFLRHMKLHTEPLKPVKCDRCSLTFSSQSKYNLHRKVHLGVRSVESKGEKQCCDICGKTVLRSSMYKHRRIHLKEYIGRCEFCNKGYHTLPEYRDHVLHHTGERPHRCDVCGTKFIRRNALIRHMRCHTGELRFWCDNCHKRYAEKSTLINHIASGRCSNYKQTGKLNKVTRRRHKRKKEPNELTVIKVLSDAELATRLFECEHCHTRHKSQNLLMRHQNVSKACKEIRSKVLPTIIEIIYAKGDNCVPQEIKEQ